ncbi:TetR/AcrR family transcriptional regulator [Nocardia sp. NPDC058519]|uniref:TetR/AcrR family transcriptional regulator n=1 Tax=Nocardia sp. NPDC058519 TaxID=3346535 RepID=UPI003658468B
MAPTDRFRPRKQPKQSRAALTRRWILDAAAQVFAEHGYAAGTTNRIAQRAGVSVGSLYQYFPNKDAILRTLMDEHVEAGTRLLDERLSCGLPAELDDVLRLFIRAVIDNHRDNPRLHRVLFEEAPRAPEFLTRLRETEGFVVEMVTQLLAQHPQVCVPHSGRAARIVVAAVESLIHRLMTSTSPMDPAELESELVIMLGGYLRNADRSGRTGAESATATDGF